MSRAVRFSAQLSLPARRCQTAQPRRYCLPWPNWSKSGRWCGRGTQSCGIVTSVDDIDRQASRMFEPVGLAPAGLGLEVEDRGDGVAAAGIHQQRLGHVRDHLRLAPFIAFRDVGIAVHDRVEGRASYAEVVGDLVLVE